MKERSIFIHDCSIKYKYARVLVIYFRSLVIIMYQEFD